MSEYDPNVYRYPIASVDLERAAEILDEHGWIQGAEGNPVEGFCAIGALRHASFERVGAQGVLMGLIADQVAELLGLRHLRTAKAYGVATFNDAPGRTKEAVQDLLILGAKKLRDMGR